MAAPQYVDGQSTQVLRLLHVATLWREYVKKKISGPETTGDWNKAWRVFSFAMEVLGAATRTRLKRYSDRAQQMAEDCTTSDKSSLARSTRCASCTSNVSGFFPARCTLGPGFPRGRQGRALFDHRSRQEGEDAEPDHGPGVRRDQVRQPGGKRSRDDGSSDGPPAKRTRRKSKKVRDQEARKAKGGERRKNSGGGGGEKARAKVTRYRAQGSIMETKIGVQLCWAWNKSRDGCAEPCPHHRSHLCKWYREPHRTIHCTKPGRV